MPNENKPRPPIVAVLGHVDHGKTSLLDYVRKMTYKTRAASPSASEPRPVAGREADPPRLAHFRSVAESEAGGITQSVGAYEITHKGKKITFIDTPGHEAFIKMRARGATIADLAILVVAADDSVKPQTQESIKILSETKTPFVVAITKIDKNNADPERVKGDLANAGVLLEGYGGSVSYHAISSKSGEGINDLLDLLLLAAEMENLTYDPQAPASGYVLESRMDRRRGTEASVILKNGTLRQGEPIATPSGKGRIKILEDFMGEPVKTLEPSAPALILGWEELPQIGEEFITGPFDTFDKLSASKLTASPAAEEVAQKTAATPGKASPAAPAKGETLNIIFKASDMGSLEALSQVILATFKEKPVKVLQESVGDVGDNDVKLAISGNALIVAFKSRTDKTVQALAEANRVKIVSSEIIYELIKAIEEFLKGGAGVEAAGELEILAVFNQKKLDKQVVGGKVIGGVFKNHAAFEISRQSEMVGNGRVQNLQEQKKDASQVGAGQEAGLLINSPVAIQVGDKLLIKEQSPINH